MRGRKTKGIVIPAKWLHWMFLFMLESLEGNRYTENGFDWMTQCITILKQSPDRWCYGWAMSSKDSKLPRNISKILFSAFCENIKTWILKNSQLAWGQTEWKSALLLLETYISMYACSAKLPQTHHSQLEGEKLLFHIFFSGFSVFLFYQAHSSKNSSFLKQKRPLAGAA